MSIVPEAADSTMEWVRRQGLPDEDAPALAAAIAAGADNFVIGGRTHFGYLFGRTVRSVQVRSLADALGILIK